jgi:ubiquitin-protein ligase E3 C
MKNTPTFELVCENSVHALEILRYRKGSSRQLQVRDRDWRAILLFLELYAFVLRFTDDEEFLGGGNTDVLEPGVTISRSRESALPLEDVKDLTMFLKNLSFTMFFNAADLNEPSEESRDGGLTSYFSTGPKQSFPTASETSASGTIKKGVENPFLGISGMTFSYVRSIVTRVLRMVYERDSRRRFLPKDHWLMTSRFDMAGFIPAVVAEEERQHQVTEEDDDEPTEESDPYPVCYAFTQH